MSRHNRRRTRGHHTHKPYGMSAQLLHPFATAATPAPKQPPLPSPQNLTVASFRRPGWGGGDGQGAHTLVARHWHNRYLAWQTRERRQREERLALEAEKRRIFGEDDKEGEGEDDGLCERMMEYFGGLDFIYDGE